MRRLLIFALFGLALWSLRGMIRRAIAQNRPRPGPPPYEPPRARGHHAILGVPEGASQAEIKAAYQRLSLENHPDRVAHMGPEIRELAARRTREINAAYQALRR